MTTLHAELFCDPFAVDSWRHRSTLKHVSYAFPELQWTLRPIVAHPDPIEGEAAASFAGDARQAGTAAGLPVADEVLAKGVPPSWSVCEALVAARSDDAVGAFELYNRLSARLFAGGEPATTVDELASVVAAIEGLDGEAVQREVGSRRATATLGRDLEIGRELFARLGEFEVRGTPDRLPLADRLLGDVVAPLDSESGWESLGDDVEDGVDEEDTDQSDSNQEASEPMVPSPPLVRIRAGDYTVVVDPAAGHQEFADVLQRFDADIGRPAWEEKLYGRKAMRAYGMEKRTAENITGENYPAKAQGVLEETGESFVADVAACTDLDPDTCRVALRKLGTQGGAERGPSGGWRPLPNRED